jgi:nucleoid-associated protein YgaU
MAQHTAVPGNGIFADGASYASAAAAFNTSYDPINGMDSTDAASRYTVAAGDTLQSIAQNIWGDSSLWYLIADANGLAGNAALQAGQSLVIPDKVVNFHNTSQGKGVTGTCPRASVFRMRIIMRRFRKKY